MGATRWVCHVLLAACFLLTCSRFGFISSDEITDVPDTDHDPTRGLTEDPTSDPTSDTTLDLTDDPIHDTSHGPTHDLTRDPTHDATHDTTHDTTRDMTSDSSHDTTPDPTHDVTSDPTQYTTSNPEYDETSSSQNLETRNKTLGEKLTSFLDEISGIDTLQKAYGDAAARGKIRFGTVDGDSLIKEVAASLGDLLGKKVEALKAAVKHAENLAEQYVWNKNLKSVGYFHANEVNESTETFEFSSQYNQIISLDNSSVHIPVDIYRGNVDILNAIAWTDGLNEVWISNKERDQSLLWQYFGSQTGVLRTYPASQWKDNSTMGKLYDVRRRPWYTQGISSPKDMLILIERSGSAHGQGLELMKHSVRSIMETLGENDFVNIVQFSNESLFVTCFGTFVQATDRNKKMMISFLDKITAAQVANYTKGFEFAFEQFAIFSKSNDSVSEGANCNQLIILFTDGGSEVPVETFRKYNSDKKIRIFTFAVGPVTSTLPVATKQIACTNRGFFYQIPAMGGIRSTVQSYLHYLAEGVCANETLPPVWSSVYDDVWDYLSILAEPLAFALDSDSHTWTSVHNDSMQLGLAISVTMPVFNRSQDLVSSQVTGYLLMDLGINSRFLQPESQKAKSKESSYSQVLSQANQTILGVMGVDVSIEEMIDATHQEKLGPTGYAFAINPNGIILFHPGTKGEDNKDISPMIDFLELEEDIPSKEKIRTEMIDQISNKVTITDFVIGLDEHHAEKKQRTYHYTAIPGTKFSVAIVLPDYVTHYVEEIDPSDFNQNGQQLLLTNLSEIIIDFKKYCWYQPVGNVTLPPASTMDEFLADILSNITTCKTELLQELLFDASITSSLEGFWISTHPENRETQSDNMGDTSSKPNHNSSNTDDSDSERNAEFDGIISRFVSTNNDFIRAFPQGASDFFENQLEPSKEAYYKRSFDNDGWIFTIYPNTSTGNLTGHHIVATKAATMKSNNYKFAVVGVHLTVQRFHDLFESIWSECSASESSACYILDDGGFIASSNHDDLEDTVGTFLGHHDSEFMVALMNDNVFERHRRLYFQEICVDDGENSAGFRLLPPFIYDILSLNWWTTASTCWLFAQVPNIVEAAKEEPPEEEPCIKSFLQYHFNDTEISSAIECKNCTRSYRTFRLEGTNLLVASIDGEPCGCDENEIFDNYEEGSDPLIDDNADGGGCSIRVRYRRRPPCYKDNPYEPESHCSASSLTATLHLCLMLLLSITLARIL